MEKKPAVLFLCTGNSCRSQMAEGLFRHQAGEQFDVHSAGAQPAAAVHQRAIQVMSELGIDITHQQPKDVGVYLGRLAVRQLFIVCDQAEEKCPRLFPGMMSRQFWPLNDPAAFVGSEEETLAEFRLIRDELKSKIDLWLSVNL